MTFEEAKRKLYTRERSSMIDALAYPDNEYCEGVFDGLHEAVKIFTLVEPEIVRCKDCKFYTPMNRETKTGICSLTLHQNFGDDWYCAGAERRSE